MSPAATFSFPAFRGLLDQVEAGEVTTFAQAEAGFLAGMGAFDTALAQGRITAGQNQNKGLFFNELIARLLERCAGHGVAQRGKRKGILLGAVDVDICFPPSPTAPPLLVAEVKMLGVPKHPGNQNAKPIGRGVGGDIDKRAREIALNVIDLKLADAAGGTSAIGDITTWIQSTRPACFVFFGMRIISSRDLATALDRAQKLANSYANGVGLALFEPVDPTTVSGRTTYQSITPPGGMRVDDALTRMCRTIRAAAPPQ